MFQGHFRGFVHRQIQKEIAKQDAETNRNVARILRAWKILEAMKPNEGAEPEVPLSFGQAFDKMEEAEARKKREEGKKKEDERREIERKEERLKEIAEGEESRRRMNEIWARFVALESEKEE